MNPLDYASPPVAPAGNWSWQALLLRAAAFIAAAIGGWFLLIGIITWRPVGERTTITAFVLTFVGWVFTLVWICRGGWLLGGLLGFVCGFMTAGYLGACAGPVFGAIAGAAAMPLTKPPGRRRRM